MTASSSHSTPMETDTVSKIATIEDELKGFRLQGYHAERFPSFIQDLDGADGPIRQAVDYITRVGVEMEEYEEHDQSDVVEAYQKDLKRENAKHQVLAAKKKYSSHDYYREFRQAIWDVKHANEPLPPDSDEDDEDDIVVNSVRLSVTCPITTAYLEEPMTSRVCKHTFSRHAVTELLRAHRGRLPCPVTGCGKVLKQQDLFEDLMAERRVERVRQLEESQRQTQNFYDVE
ncbi:zinc-finger of the MIZ type in Nse subunit-domain-containing protein [Fennellomyces sp. T-0311]|nr:zinc-finger of the MIZ type in Nse subunit-domain-containing protein [Fennellomyces sp. T-0311]